MPKRENFMLKEKPKEQLIKMFCPHCKKEFSFRPNFLAHMAKYGKKSK